MTTNTKSRGCGSKQAHPTRAAAEKHMWSLVNRGARAAGLNVYRCKHCPGWHVGHKPRGRRR